ncbi:MAG: WecB/TagA/CpsF family glycosyltransferase [Alphaproteobacteria bacterium]|nr:WecB/TagA/CpsF family glycosyltransferase [Alphaproteobacteria bacterium]
MSVSPPETPGASPKDALTRPVWSVFGMPVDAVSLEEAEAAVRAAVRERRRLSFVTPNLNWLVRALKDDTAMRQIREADLSLADGAPVVWMARKLGAPVPERVAGSDLFDRLRRKRPGEAPIRVYFLGGRAGAAEKAAERLNAENGGMIACGHLNPGYGDVASMSAPVILDTINRARADFLVVSLGAAKGQAWISANQHRLNAPVIAHLGAVVDFVAGTVPRAPESWAQNGFEWLWRIRSEPGLIGRYGRDGWALLRLVPGRLWPLQRDLAHQGEADNVPARASFARNGAGSEVRLSGALVSGGLDDVLAALQAARRAGGEIRIDLSGACRVDAAFAGLLLTLGEAVRRAGHRLEVRGAGAGPARVLRALGIEMAPHGAQPAAMSADPCPS